MSYIVNETSKVGFVKRESSKYRRRFCKGKTLFERSKYFNPNNLLMIDKRQGQATSDLSYIRIGAEY